MMITIYIENPEGKKSEGKKNQQITLTKRRMNVPDREILEEKRNMFQSSE